MTLVLVYDAIGANVSHLPPGRKYAGYSTGSGSVPWTGTQFAEHPGTLRICQDAGATDRTADYLDIERGAATVQDAPGWYRDALHNYVTGVRPGQREPGFYISQSGVTPLVNELVGAGIKSGPVLVVANWNLTETQAETDVLDASGPFPIVGVQFASLQFYDVNIMSGGWLNRVSKLPPHLVSVEMIAHLSDGSSKTYTAA